MNAGRMWRRRTPWVAVLGVALLAVLGSAQAAPGTDPGKPTFSDSFDVSPNPDWTFHNRDGEISGGALRIQGDYFVPDPVQRDGWATTHAGDTGWRNYTFTASYNTENVGGFPETVHQANFFFRVIDPTPGSGTYYRATVWDVDQESPTSAGGWLPDGYVELGRFEDGQITMLAAIEYTGTVTGDNAIKIRVTGSRIQIWANGTRIVSVVDPEPLRYGGVGVGQIWETNGVFYDVTVAPVR